MMILSLVAMIGLEKKCCITFEYMQWLCHSDERVVARGPLVFVVVVVTLFMLKEAKLRVCQDKH